MWNRLVSASSLFVVFASAVFVALFAWWILMGKVDGVSGIFALAGWLMAAIVFSYRSADPAWLDPVSIVKG